MRAAAASASPTRSAAFTLLLFLAGGINPYLLVMTTGVYGRGIGEACSRTELGWREDGLALAPVSAAFGALVLFGFLNLHGPGVIPGQGYGYFSANLNSLVNPMDGPLGSSLLPSLPLWGRDQYEGYGYLGWGRSFL